MKLFRLSNLFFTFTLRAPLPLTGGLLSDRLVITGLEVTGSSEPECCGEAGLGPDSFSDPDPDPDPDPGPFVVLLLVWLSVALPGSAGVIK
eukprot:CAMPEP_0174255240 /NCGR_PEP_ID=MMETSP0439-20130205/4585_1 /TAXON_ID=0 /ORGANISM="Stereomyxa ramosa, Strain Chinc5" /LENGTH=90 /DNA_ID=CAMNT_0015337335 /DNA_START=146 /DNA_END=419 /DNA_ORIENTATION=+